MTVYVQMKDNVAFAYVESNSPVENSIVLDESIDPNSVLAHKLLDGEWTPAPLIYFISEISEDGIVKMVSSTVYSSDVTGEIVSENVGFGWKKENGEWINFLEKQQQEEFEKQQQEQELQRQKELEDFLVTVLNSRPFPSWNWANGEWVPPTPKPDTSSEDYYWDEPTLSWQPYIDSTEPFNEITS